MDWTWYLFSFKGRINRAKYWLAGLVILSFMLIFVALVQLSLTINFVAHVMGAAHGKGEISFGFDLDDIFGVLDPAAWRALSFAKLPMLLVRAIGTAIMLVLMIWGFVELYFLRGTKWTNRFGPDPLGKEQMRARSERARLRATTPWDQESEIEMVPHTASPPPLWRVNPGG